MPGPLPLAGARLVLTRPREWADALARSLRAAGAETLGFPALAVEPTTTPAPTGPFDLAIFVSPAAVRHGLPRTGRVLPARVSAPGPGTARRLATAGVSGVVAPARGAGLAALLAEPGLGPLRGRRVLLVCGRPLNRRSVAQLRARGAEVAVFSAYSREPATAPEPLAGWLRRGEADAIMASSAAAVAALGALPGIDWLGTDWIVSSRRVASAVEAVHGRVAATAAGADAAAMTAAAASWWRSATTGRNRDG